MAVSIGIMLIGLMAVLGRGCLQSRPDPGHRRRRWSNAVIDLPDDFEICRFLDGLVSDNRILFFGRQAGAKTRPAYSSCSTLQSGALDRQRIRVAVEIMPVNLSALRKFAADSGCVAKKISRLSLYKSGKRQFRFHAHGEGRNHVSALMLHESNFGETDMSQNARCGCTLRKRAEELRW